MRQIGEWAMENGAENFELHYSIAKIRKGKSCRTLKYWRLVIQTRFLTDGTSKAQLSGNKHKY